MAELDSGTKIAVNIIASKQIGTLIQNTARQSTYSMSNPPTIGPNAIEMPTTPPHMPITRARSTLPVNTCVTIDNAAGVSIEPPIACRKRAPINVSTLGATLHTSEANAKTVNPIWNVRRRPNRSAMAPESSNSEAIIKV